MTEHPSSLRVGIVGAGIRGSLFAQAIGQHPDAALVAVCDKSEAAAGKLADRHGLAAFTDVEPMLAGPTGLDAVVIATPDFAHRDAAVAAAEAGLSLMIEKPLATTVADARAIADAVARGSGSAMIGFENRWNPRFTAVKSIVDSGQTGPLRHQVVHLNDTLHVPTEMLPWAGQSSPAWFLMPHSLDLALWLSGQVPVRVYATGVKGLLSDRGIATWDAIDAVFTLSDGSAVTLHSSWILPESYPAVYDLRYEAVGTSSAVRVSGADQGVHHFGPGGLTWPQHGVHSSRGRLHGFPVEMAYDFVDFALGRAVEVPTIDEGIRVTEAIEAVHRSLELATPIDLNP
jgi:predicted dehydrogenase